jgi:UDP-N-acetylglucosamine diphosphorylase / glucose-1-phosphate thymidylyltransferase / UDP-N-acetylgalactosamine diphosphorylase / glucosamine-1-phosphate N-acetyltransferase / galactosamine-1-phosphate N-acetyltransferase
MVHLCDAMKAADFFTLPPSLAEFASFFSPEIEPWAWLKVIGVALKSLPKPEPLTDIPPGVHIEGAVYLAPDVKLPAYCTLIGPCWIGPGVDIRPGAYVRGNVIVGAGCVLGNACEFKNCLLMDKVQVPHFSYVGDSILGNGAHLGAGAICSNLRLDQKPVTVRTPERTYESGLRKFGAILGDAAEVGCNSVLNPGCVLGKYSLVAPGTVLTGYLPAHTIARQRGSVSHLPRRD